MIFCVIALILTLMIKPEHVGEVVLQSVRDENNKLRFRMMQVPDGTCIISDAEAIIEYYEKVGKSKISKSYLTKYQ